MTSVRQIDGLWSEGRTRQLVTELTRFRPDFPASLIDSLSSSAVVAAALAMMRLQELDQTLFASYEGLERKLLASQAEDGSFGSIPVTALACRALLVEPTSSEALRKGLEYLGSMQREDGSFPIDSPRRLPGDLLTTALCIYHLSRDDRAKRALRFELAGRWLADHRMDALPLDRAFVQVTLTRAGQSIAGQAKKLLDLAA